MPVFTGARGLALRILARIAFAVGAEWSVRSGARRNPPRRRLSGAPRRGCARRPASSTEGAITERTCWSSALAPMLAPDFRPLPVARPDLASFLQLSVFGAASSVDRAARSGCCVGMGSGESHTPRNSPRTKRSSVTRRAQPVVGDVVVVAFIEAQGRCCSRDPKYHGALHILRGTWPRPDSDLHEGLERLRDFHDYRPMLFR